MASMISHEHGVQPPTWHLGEFTLRPLRSGDHVAWSEYLSDPEVIRHTSWERTDLVSIRDLVEASPIPNLARSSTRLFHLRLAERDLEGGRVTPN